MALTCELCGGNDFVKQDGMFVCQGCGCKYSIDEARKLMAQASESASVQEQEVDVTGQPQGAQAINNYACRAWQTALRDYKKIEHPDMRRQDKLGEHAEEALSLLDNAARLEPENHLQNILILENCKEIVSQAHATSYYDKDEEGRYHSHAFRLDVRLPGQSESWDDLLKFHRAFIEQRYREGHPDEVEERAALVARKNELDEQIAELNSEKRSKGFFNFSEKREVKERMRPYKDELSQVQTKIRELDGKVDAYVDKRVKELEAGYIRL